MSDENTKPTIAECCELRECCPCCPNGYCEDETATADDCHRLQSETDLYGECCDCCKP
jgi:hypothetical protein